VEGRVTDARSGRPLAATVDVYSPRTNPNLARYPGYSGVGERFMGRTGADGRFRVPAVPGAAAVAIRLMGTDEPDYFGRGKPAIFQAGRHYPFLRAVKIDGLSDEPLAVYKDVEPSVLTAITYNRIRGVDVPADKASVECDFTVE
jgi:hypothetical protein